MFAREMGSKRDNQHNSTIVVKERHPRSKVKLNLEDSLEAIRQDQEKLKELRIRRQVLTSEANANFSQMKGGLRSIREQQTKAVKEEARKFQEMTRKKLEEFQLK